MGKFALQVCGTLENIDSLQTPQPHFNYIIRYKCTSCREATEAWQFLAVSNVLKGSGIRGEVHHRARCKHCRKESSIIILPQTVSSYNKADSEDFKSIVTMDFRGVEPIDFDFAGGWCAVSASSHKFEDCDLSGGEWVEYDEQLKACVSVLNMKARFVKVNN